MVNREEPSAQPRCSSGPKGFAFGPLSSIPVLYVAKFEEAVYVLHAFEKKSRQTRDTDLTLARERLRQVQVLRREAREK